MRGVVGIDRTLVMIYRSMTMGSILKAVAIRSLAGLILPGVCSGRLGTNNACSRQLGTGKVCSCVLPGFAEGSVALTRSFLCIQRPAKFLRGRLALALFVLSSQALL